MKLTYPFGNRIGEQFGHLLAVGTVETDGETGDPVVYDCKCMKCGKEHIHVLDRDLLSYKVRCCSECDPNDLVGMKFGRWLVLKRDKNDANYRRKYICKCTCDKHTIRSIPLTNLLKGTSRSCGCIQRELASKLGLKDLTGQVFGRLTVLRRAPNLSRGNTRWVCQCSCKDHTIVTVDGSALKRGMTRSCGCLHRETAVIQGRIRGKANAKWTEEESIILSHYTSMMTRCYNKRSNGYQFWGGRGIRVCDEWRDPTNGRRSFIDWARSSGFDKKLTLDRTDVNGPYAPWNCRWITIAEQNRNKRDSIKVKILEETKTVAEWARLCGVERRKLYKILERKGIEHLRSVILNLINQRK